ncbi:DUF3379 domain-containing protein [Poritiphilus flavus]|uniref:Anti-sigma factor n=1 Tax=Poritiphilus flavus TaxID=2697053 RepID=A0A6L9EBF0_9FLAO|nr:DUF3379 domain-containing protein [Poritiphilus flavus]NAS12076.1 hypothetical protein [Poritiphilus flavus]
MKEEQLDELFKKLQGSFDVEEPASGHRDRFLDKLSSSQGVVSLQKKKTSWWRPLSIAASFALLCVLGITYFNSSPSLEEQLAEISPEVSQTQFYFASLIEEQVKVLESESSPETKKLIDDTMIQLQKLEEDYKVLEQEILNGGNSKLILSAMITNFQTRIDLLQEVMNKIDTIKNLKLDDDENYTI